MGWAAVYHDEWIDANLVRYIYFYWSMRERSVVLCMKGDRQCLCAYGGG